MARRRKGTARHPDLDQSWMIFTRCWMCGNEFVVNNYADHKPRVKHMRIGGHIICPWCRSQKGTIAREFVKLVLLAERAASAPCQSDYVPEDRCKCLPCIAQRIVTSLELTPEKFYRKKSHAA